MEVTNQEATRDPAPVKRPTILRRILSHHEIATLLLLLHGPVNAMAKPEFPMLKEVGLVEEVRMEGGEAGFQLTPDGNTVLRGLGVK